MKLGQAATEHVLLLAIVLIIALVVVVMLAGNPEPGEMQLGTSKAYWDNAFPVAIKDTYQENGNGSLIVRLMNRGTDAVTVVSFDISNGGRTNSTYFGGGVVLGPGESRNVPVKTPLTTGGLGEYKVKISYNSNGIDYQYRGMQPLLVIQAPPVCMFMAGSVCSSSSDCCPTGGLSCQGGSCAACYSGGSLCSSSESCCTGACVPVFGYSACCLASGASCQVGGFPPPVPCCSGSCNGGACS